MSLGNCYCLVVAQTYFMECGLTFMIRTFWSFLLPFLVLPHGLVGDDETMPMASAAWCSCLPADIDNYSCLILSVFGIMVLLMLLIFYYLLPCCFIIPHAPFSCLSLSFWPSIFPADSVYCLPSLLISSLNCLFRVVMTTCFVLSALLSTLLRLLLCLVSSQLHHLMSPATTSMQSHMT